MRVVCVTAARLFSSRLARKPFQTIARQPPIRMVARRAVALGLFDDIVVASDHDEVLRAIRDLPVQPVLTSRSHRNGTERVAEVVARQFGDADVVVNLQGDEPFIPREAVAGAIGRVTDREPIGTAGCDLGPEDRDNEHAVKVIVDPDGTARSFARHVEEEGNGVAEQIVLRHLGVYAYRPAALARCVGAAAVPAETEQRLEQLRPLAHGERIGVARVDGPAPPGIDTLEDVRNAERMPTVTC